VRSTHGIATTCKYNPFIFIALALARCVHLVLPFPAEEDAMETFAEALSIIGALLLSVSCGLLVEELVFGGLVRLFVAQQTKIRKAQERQSQGEDPCLR
jgi:hypothetical protein